jgi:D-glycero-D-manno-heptose 1,7-bisphosphate phosphatase
MKKKAIFLDRDGTLNVDIWYAYKIEDCHLIEKWIWNILQQFRNKWYLLIIITNQAWIDKWFYCKKDFDLFMIELSKQLNIDFDEIYFCPYHPDFTWLRSCRKPNNWMILQAEKDFNIDLKKSFMIWDNFKDIESWKKSNCKTILINTQNLNIDDFEIKVDFITSKWNEIEKIILDN